MLSRKFLRQASFTRQQKTLFLVAGGFVVAVILRLSDMVSVGAQGSALSLYAASRLLSGRLPYSAVWYGGFPGTIVFDAVALAVSRNIYSVVVLEALFAAAGALLIYVSVKRMNPHGVTAGIYAGWLAAAAVGAGAFGGANSPSAWVFLPAAGFVYAIVTGERGKDSRSFWAGICAGMAFCVHPREIALIPAGLLMLRGRGRILFIVGFAAAPLITAAILISTGAMNSFIESAFIFWPNIHLEPMAQWHVIFPAAAGLVLPYLVSIFARGKEQGGDDDARGMTVAFTVWAVLELAAVFTSVRINAVDIVPLCIPLCLLSAMRTTYDDPAKAQSGMNLIFTAFMVGFVALAAVASLASLSGSMSYKTAGIELRDEQFIADMARRDAAPGRPVQVWGDSALTNFLADRPASSKYVTVVPLFARGASGASVEKFINDLRANPPDVLIMRLSPIPDIFAEQIGANKYLFMSSEQNRLFLFLHYLLRKQYKAVAVRHGVVYCRRMGL